MPQKSRSKRPNQTTQGATNTPDVIDAAREGFDTAMRTGQQLQQETGQWWNRLWSQTTTGFDWQRQVSTFTKVTAEAMPMLQQRAEDMIEFLGRSGRTGAELMGKATTALQAPFSGDSQAVWMDLWTATLKAAQTNVEAATSLGTNAIDSWLVFVRNNTEIAQIRVPKAA